MGREFIGECPGWGDDPESDDVETELAIKYIKQSCGPPPNGVDVQVTFEGYEVGNEGDEVSYPVISVVWDDYTAEYPGEYIGKCIEAYERFELPEEIYQRGQHFFDIYERIQKLFDQD
jgi:hypothetical protein